MRIRGAAVGFVGIVVLCGLLLFARPVRAAEAEGIRVQPLRSYPALDPGTTRQGSLKLTNQTKKSQRITMNVENFSVEGEDYDYNFRDSEETKWITFDATAFTLKPDQTKTVNYNLAVPGNAAPGGHYFSLLTTIDPPKSSEGVTEIRRVASLVYLQVNGDIVLDSKLSHFDMPWITFKNVVPADVYIANSGTSHVRSRTLIEGRTFLMRLMGKPKNEVALVEGVIMPGTLRRLPTNLHLPSRPGMYRIAAQYSPDHGESSTLQHTIIYIPLWFGLVLIGLSLGIAWTSLRYIKSRNRSTKSKKPMTT